MICSRKGTILQIAHGNASYKLLVSHAKIANFFGGSEKSSIFAVPNEKEV